MDGWAEEDLLEPPRTEAQKAAAERIKGDDGLLSYAESKAAQDEFETRLRETGDFEQAFDDVVRSGNESDDPDPASMP